MATRLKVKRKGQLVVTERGTCKHLWGEGSGGGAKDDRKTGRNFCGGSVGGMRRAKTTMAYIPQRGGSQGAHRQYRQ